MIGIPEHKCRSCGDCCGMVPITDAEIMMINNYLHTMPDETKQQLEDNFIPGKCLFRNHVQQNCAIYPVRPMICRLFGVINSKVFTKAYCTYGNSGDIIPPFSLINPDEKRTNINDVFIRGDDDEEDSSR